jgi:hypothetical protein
MVRFYTKKNSLGDRAVILEKIEVFTKGKGIGHGL